MLYRGYVLQGIATVIYHQLREETQWLHPSYENPDGRVVHIPRLTANYGERSYDYSGLTFTPVPWTPLLEQLKAVAEYLTGETYNALILQYYRDGSDGVGWHSDNDPCIAKDPTIVSMSFGETRGFWFRHTENKTERLKLEVHSGDVLIMRGDLQDHYVHKVPKETGKSGRINLTFRKVEG